MAMIRPAANDGGSSPVLWRGTEEFGSDNMVKYRREMMELVKDAPETAYELTLRDLVEISEPEKARDTPQKEEEKMKKKKRVRNWKKGLLKSRNMDITAFQLRAFLPNWLWRWRRKVSPKPSLVVTETVCEKKADGSDDDERRMAGCNLFSINLKKNLKG